MLEIIVARLTNSHPTLQSPNPPTSQGAGSWAGSQEPGGRGRSGDRSYKVEFSTVPALGRLHAPMRPADPWAFQALPGDLPPRPMLSSVPLRSCLLDGTCLWWKGILLSTRWRAAVGSRVSRVAAALPLPLPVCTPGVTPAPSLTYALGCLSPLIPR